MGQNSLIGFHVKGIVKSWTRWVLLSLPLPEWASSIQERDRTLTPGSNLNQGPAFHSSPGSCESSRDPQQATAAAHELGAQRQTERGKLGLRAERPFCLLSSSGPRSCMDTHPAPPGRLLLIWQHIWIKTAERLRHWRQKHSVLQHRRPCCHWPDLDLQFLWRY